MRLKPGDLAPDFSIQDVHGNTIRLSDYRGKKLLLCLYRYAGCPFCNLALHDLITHRAEFENLGLKIVAFFQSSKESVLEIPGKQTPSFPLVADPDRAVFDKYGVEVSVAGTARTLMHMDVFIKAHLAGFPQRAITGNFFLMPAEFLIDADGRIALARYGNDISDILSSKDVFTFLFKDGRLVG